MVMFRLGSVRVGACSGCLIATDTDLCGGACGCLPRSSSAAMMLFMAGWVCWARGGRLASRDRSCRAIGGVDSLDA